ncbi:hypothetical protein L484_021529 [Morus notabilis]|uniref:Uncharacterized protein n=1 Tax=Morus notabilis TaxID=981085 RepID=W9S0L2_9ROSA|nr:hypothetical protein L484_021529 [Morus notabilis]
MDNIDPAAVQEGLPSELNSIFNEMELVNNEATQKTDLIQQSETGIDMSNNVQDQDRQNLQEQAEGGSSCGSSTDEQPLADNDQAISSGNKTENVAVSAFTNTSSITVSDPDLAHENIGPNMAPTGTSSSDDNPSMSGTPDDVSELGLPQNQNLDLTNHAQNKSGGENISGTPLLNDPNLQPLGTIYSSNLVLTGAPQQHPPIMDNPHPELRSLVGSNWSNIKHSANSRQNLMMMQPPFSSFQLHSPNRSLEITSPSVIDIPRLSSFFNGISLPMGMSMAQDTAVLQSFRREDDHQPNLIYPYHSNAYSENFHHGLVEQHFPAVSRSMGATSQFGTNNVQPFQILSSNNFMDNNISQQPSPYSNSLPQNTGMTGTGVADQSSQLINPHQAIFAPFNMLNAAFSPAITTSAGFWPQQFLPNQPQQFSQVPPMSNIAHDTNLEYSSPHHGPQNLSYYHVNHQPSNTAPAVYDRRPLLYNSMLPEVPFNPRPSQFSYPRQQLNEMLPKTNTSLIPESNAMSSRIPPTLHTGVQQVNQSSVIPNMLGPQEYSNNSVTPPSATPTNSGPSSILSRLSNTDQRQIETLSNACPAERFRSSSIPMPSILTRSRARSQQTNDLLTAGANKSDPIVSLMQRSQAQTRLPIEISSTNVNGTIPPDSQILNSQIEQEGGYRITGVAIPNQSVTSSMKELGEAILDSHGRPRATKRLEIGESIALLSKRVRRDIQEGARKESNSPSANVVSQNVIKFGTSQSEENNEADSANISSRHTTARRTTNGVYDPKYEEMGLPIDPHLRMFAAFNQKHVIE